MMPIGRDMAIILSNLKGLFIIIGSIMLGMAAISAYIGETQVADGFFYGAVLGIGLGMILHSFYPAGIDPELRHAMVIAAIAYLVVPGISAIPYVVTGHMSPLDAFFEAISGWTGSGFSMMPEPQSSHPMILLWRSITQWIGGLGVILLMVTILIRPGTSTYMLYQSEARKDKILPSIRSTLNVIWSLYLALTILAMLLLLATGLPAWDALNTAMTAISTGGFSIYGESIAAYHSLPLELALLPIMVAGALPFAVMYRTARKGVSKLFDDAQVKAFIFMIVAGALLLSIENYYYYGNIAESIRYSVFQFISAITCTGFQSADVSQWSQTALLMMSIAMVIGGCAGSTAGGIKVARAIFVGNEVKLWFTRMLHSKNSIVAIKIGGKRVTEDVVDQEMAEASLISFLWLISALVSVLLLSHIVGQRFDLSHIIFAVCSAQGNVGITCGVINQSLPAIGKLLVIMNMWVGRLEIIPVLVLVRYLLKGFKS
ncbi:Trk-type K+ transport system, membrane component [Methanocella conradii HZ254]|uniref:Trk-type K+ transport system, membrane component n=1 Tax=Methanocella conradii (strain DSM 24694 / JCM 17849 / CGMCC 1.5162 / HZ254) TaxID=1041930 RepID=H8I4E4_METCZ|nr:TrkH family potassium uptake protein [Methanocella conradii]AFC99701.1 Trk-type K+ transport system, membrane component [Methanocella conradii HZ254]MDI6896584.1 TrkH family potassium uptake protein [Methanocella conradii]